jgi:hypothetical protein|tara:strand:- start:711 stop:1052 length:342 start_codon:yes stop_codon:yes gene_type:complete
MNHEAQAACSNANVLFMNGYVNALVGSMARLAAKGRTPGWQVVKSFNELQNIQSTILLGDPTQYMTNMLSNTLPINPPVPSNKPQYEQVAPVEVKPQWAIDLEARIVAFEAKQ